MSTNSLTIPTSPFQRIPNQQPNTKNYQTGQQCLQLSNFSFALKNSQQQAEQAQFYERRQDSCRQTLSKCLSSPLLQNNNQKHQQFSLKITNQPIRTSAKQQKNKASEVTTMSDVSSTFEQNTKDGYNIKVMPQPYQDNNACSPKFKYFRGERQANQSTTAKENYQRQSQLSQTSSIRCISEINLVTSPKLKGVKLKDYLFTANATRQMLRQNKRNYKKAKRCITEEEQESKQSDKSIDLNMSSSLSIAQSKVDSRKLMTKVIKKQIFSQLSKLMAHLSEFQNSLQVRDCSQQQLVGMYRKRDLIKRYVGNLQRSCGKLGMGDGESSRVNIILEDESELLDV